MSFLRRKEKNLIPPVEDNNQSYSSRPTSSSAVYNQSRDTPPSYRSAPSISSTYGGNNDDSSYRISEHTGGYRSQPKNDVYSRGERNLDADRDELLGGYKPSAGRSNRFTDGPRLNDEFNDEEEDEEAIKRSTRFTKQESVNSTRNALRIAREAEETGRNTLLRLGDQSEKLANTERHLDVAKGLSNKAEDRADELKKLNRSIFRPAITFNKDAKRRAQELKLQNRYEEEREERERSMADIRQTHDRIGKAATYGINSKEEEEDEGILAPDQGTGYRSSRIRSAETLEQRKKYQIDATASDDELENELDDNLDDIAQASSRLKALGLAMGQELETQNSRLDRIDGKVGRLDNKIYNNTEKLKRIK